MLFELPAREKSKMITKEDALPGRAQPMSVAYAHAVNGAPLKGPYPVGMQKAVFALGCFWGAERLFWNTPGVYVTAVGYIAGFTPNPTYEEVCSGKTGHTEAVLAVYDPDVTGFPGLCRLFWESHDPTQGMRQGNDIGTQYRSGLYTCSDDQAETAKASRDRYQAAIKTQGLGVITTEIAPASPFYFAEGYHQQYLHKNPNGYCGLGGTGISCPG